MLKITKQFLRPIDEVFRAPRFRRANIAKIAISGDDRLHACCKARLDISYVIAQIDAFAWSDVYCVARSQQRFRVRLGMSSIAAADDARRTVAQAQFLH